MISVKQLLYKLDMRLNKVATNEHQSIPDEDKILALNEGQLKLIKKKVDINNIFQLGMDGFKKRYEDLQNLTIPYEKISVTKSDSLYQSYKADLNNLEHKYMLPISIGAICSKDGCTGRAIVANKVNKHSDIPTLMYNTNYNPSFEYMETLCSISENDLYLYTDGTFVIDYAYVSYMRYPIKMDIEGYITIDGLPSVTQDCELVDYLEDELLDIVELDLKLNTDNPSTIQTFDIRTKNNE